MGRPTAGFTVRKKCQKVWAKLLRYADMRDGIFTEAFRGPARAHPDLGKFGLLVIWVTLARLSLGRLSLCKDRVSVMSWP